MDDEQALELAEKIVEKIRGTTLDLDDDADRSDLIEEIAEDILKACD